MYNVSIVRKWPLASQEMPGGDIKSKSRYVLEVVSDSDCFWTHLNCLHNHPEALDLWVKPTVGTPMGQVFPTHTKTHTHHRGCGFLGECGCGYELRHPWIHPRQSLLMTPLTLSCCTPVTPQITTPPPRPPPRPMKYPQIPLSFSTSLQCWVLMVSSLISSVSDTSTSICAFTVTSMVTLQGTVPCPLVLSPMPPGLCTPRTITYILIVRVHPPTSNTSTPFPYAILLRLPLLYAPLLRKPVITSIDNSVKLR